MSPVSMKTIKLMRIPEVMLAGKPIEYTETHKLLGMAIDNLGSDNKDIITASQRHLLPSYEATT